MQRSQKLFGIDVSLKKIVIFYLLLCAISLQDIGDHGPPLPPETKSITSFNFHQPNKAGSDLRLDISMQHHIL